MGMESIDPNVFVILEILRANKKESIKSNIIFQKIAFLSLINFEKLFTVADFIPHRFGPYSESLKMTKKQLINMGEIEVLNGKELKITEKGLERLNQVEKELAETPLKKFKNIIQDNKESFNDFNTDEILAYIYKSFPEYVEPSIKAEQIDYEKQFLKRGKLGISSISKLLGLTSEEAIEWIKNNTKSIILK